ncbi:MMPL family transporter [Crenobacter sp. SG2305]|uniref:hopanoid transporter HpnN n=1 Tax=Crenobacter oryzisoli TaxID=3056844 RepID=UPI0025AB4508|nr:MMPL family transporter [Crenobacter sp. SG2305]MDN0084211.1 MMPL family transporter [Crenobacter sp. SG2305]
MLTLLITRLVRFATRRAWAVILVALLLSLASGVYVAKHFAINTDIDRLLDVNAPWAQRDAAIGKAFPQRNQQILAVVQAPAPELAEAAADALADALRGQTQHFLAVSQPGGGDFFARAGLLFLPTKTVDEMSTQLVQARPLINTLAHDPTLRGLADTLSTTLALPLQLGQVKLGDMAGLLDRSATTIEKGLAGKPAALSWVSLAASQADFDAQEKASHPVLLSADGNAMTSSFVTVRPVLNFSNLQAGAAASGAIRATAAQLGLKERFGATVRLTGPQPLADDEFASVRDGAVLNSVLTALVVVLILWLALRSTKLIVAVLLSLFAGLVITAALGLAMVGALNMISVAFAMLFVGLGGDFGIQFGIRYRAERHHHDYLPNALALTAQGVGVPLALASAATAVAFFSFLPTDYRGVAELGQIAGVGMIVAFATTVTLLPALIHVLCPAGESRTPSFPWLAPADRFFDRHRKSVLLFTCAAILAGTPLLPHLRFDFDPLSLKDPRSESMSTLLALKDAPQVGTEDVSVLAPSLTDAQLVAKRLKSLPEVARVVTLQDFIPEQQPAKLERIAAAAAVLAPLLGQTTASPASDTLRVAALRRLATQLELAAEDHPGPGAEPSERLAKALRKLASADAAARDRAERAVALPLRLALGTLQRALQAQPVSRQSLPPELVHDWLTPDGRALVSVSPKLPRADSPDRPVALDRFIAAVLRAEPSAAGGPISVRGSADTIMSAFAQAGAWAVLSITLLLWITLRRFGDVLRTLLPLLVSTVVTLELCVVFGISLNFANVIALPLLLGVGVAFKIYYVIAWRTGHTNLLQSSLTHAVLFSAATTAAAFGSLWLSQHPGTSSMGKLLTLALACTLIGAVFFQPILMGKPRPAARTAGPKNAGRKQSRSAGNEREDRVERPTSSIHAAE